MVKTYYSALTDQTQKNYWTIKTWNQLPAEAFGAFPCKSQMFRQRIRRGIISRVKLNL
jgi:hypothetical protein